MDAHALYSATEGKPGVDLLRLTARQADALRTVGAAVAWRTEQEMDDREKKRARERGR